MEISCIVLAGGKSTRLGRNKITENIGGKMLLERVLDSLSLFKGEIIIVTSAQSTLPGVDKYPQVRIVNDIYPDKGSLGGIYSGIFFSRTFYNLLVAGDMPFLSFNLLHYMADIAQGYDLVAFREGERFEPLHAVYSKNCILPLEMLLKQDNVRIIELLGYLSNVRYLTLAEIAEFDPRHLSFFNINNEDELHKAVRIALTEFTRLSPVKIPG
jgi:molybdopterin-guanine dinucleotide biosynthesis protein A